MAKRTWRDYKNDYDQVIQNHGINPDDSKFKISDQIIDIAENIQHQICVLSDDIKIHAYKDAKEIMGKEIRKNDWLDMVNSGIRSASSDKVVVRLKEKISDEIGVKQYVNLVNEKITSNLDSGNQIDSLELPQEYEKIKVKNTYTDEYLNQLYKDCMAKRVMITKQLYREYCQLSRAFQYLYEGRLTHDDFKILVDDQVYIDGGYPSPDTPPRTFSKIERFIKLFNAMCIAGREDYINEYLEKFGYKVEKIGENKFKNGFDPSIRPEHKKR